VTVTSIVNPHHKLHNKTSREHGDELCAFDPELKDAIYARNGSEGLEMYYSSPELGLESRFLGLDMRRVALNLAHLNLVFDLFKSSLNKNTAFHGVLSLFKNTDS